MKRRTLCLLLAGVMTLSLLSGCGGKDDAGAKDDGAKNSAPAATDAGGPTESAEPTAPGESAPAGISNPLFDRLAVQFHDVTLKPGMTLGEAIAAIDASELPLTYPDEFSPENLKQELSVPQPFTGVTGDKEIPISGQEAHEKTFTVEYNGSPAFSVVYIDALPGEAGTTYLKRDLLVFAVHIRSSDGYADEVRTFLGTGAELGSLSEDDIRSIAAAENAELKITEPDPYDDRGYFIEMHYTAPNDFRWNGYKLMNLDHELGLANNCYTYYAFYFDTDGNMSRWSIFSYNGIVWATDDAG